MPENNDPTVGDPFAELYGRLPDPRTDGATRRRPAPADDAPASGIVDAPPSRRAARQARAQNGATETQPAGSESTPPISAIPAADAAASTRPTSSEPTGAEPTAPRPSVARSASERPATEQSTAPARSATERMPAAAPAREPEPVLVGAASASTAAGQTSAPATAGSLEDLFAGRAHTDQIGASAQRPPKKRRRVGGWIALAVVLVIVGGLVGGGFALWNTYGERVQAFLGTGEPTDFEAGMATGEARVTIVSGDTGESVSPKMYDAGVTKASDSLYKYMIDNSVGFTFQPGVYKLQKQMTSEAVIAALRDPASRLDNSVQLREGLTLNQSLDAMSEQLGIPRADLDAAVSDPSVYGVPASTLEGWIFPATYDFDEGVSATDVISRMVQRTIQSLDTAGVPVDDRERILTVASIIEREARSSEDFYKVSRVIENRLDPSNQETFGKLEMDSTVQYGAGEIGSGSVSTSEEARNNDNPYNTYIHPGLPVGPISNPGDLAIDAAMKPADGPWLYFVTVNLDTGETVFTSTYSEHLKAVDQWRAWCTENPDSGC